MKLYGLRGNKIFFPRGTSEWVGISDPKPLLKLTITSGGGMGGSRWERFVVPQTIKEGLNWFTTVDGEEICINSNYIVEIRPVDLYIAEYICTNHNFGLYNDLCEIAVYTSKDVEPILIAEYKELRKWTYD